MRTQKGPACRPAGFIPVLAVIVAIIVLAAGYFIYNQSSKIPVKVTPQQATRSATSSAETANWKTYVNKLVGFSIKYPANFKVRSGEDFLTLDEGTISKLATGCERPTFRVELNIAKTDKTSLSQISPQKTYPSVSDQSEIRLANVPAIRFKWAVNNCEYGENVLMLFKGYSINIANFASDSRTESEFNQILSTFKFTQ